MLFKIGSHYSLTNSIYKLSNTLDLIIKLKDMIHIVNKSSSHFNKFNFII